MCPPRLADTFCRRKSPVHHLLLYPFSLRRQPFVERQGVLRERESGPFDGRRVGDDCVEVQVLVFDGLAHAKVAMGRKERLQTHLTSLAYSADLHRERSVKSKVLDERNEYWNLRHVIGGEVGYVHLTRVWDELGLPVRCSL